MAPTLSLEAQQHEQLLCAAAAAMRVSLSWGEAVCAWEHGPASVLCRQLGAAHGDADLDLKHSTAQCEQLPRGLSAAPFQGGPCIQPLRGPRRIPCWLPLVDAVMLRDCARPGQAPRWAPWCDTRSLLSPPSPRALVERLRPGCRGSVWEPRACSLRGSLA